MKMEFDNYGEKMTKVVNLKDAEDLGNGKYRFTFYVNSLQMAEDINATFYYGDGEFIAHTTSVKAYAEALVLNSTNPKSVELAKAILSYGYYAQLALQETHEFTLGTDGKYDAMPVPANTPDTSIDLSEYALKLGGASNNITALSMSLALDKKTDIYIYITTDTEPTVTGADVEIEKVGERYRITIPNIAAHELATTYTLNIDGLTVDVSAFSYINTVLKSTTRSTNYKLAAAALYEYYTAAVAYAAK